MKDGLLVGMNRYGFDDDSMIYEEENTKKNTNNFLADSGNIMISSINNENNYDENNNDENNYNEQKTLSLNTSNSLRSTFNEPNIMIEDCFSNIYYIPMNTPSVFSESKNAHQFIYKSNPKSNINTKELEFKKFAASKNSEIVTYLLCLHVFSEFVNLDELEKDKRFKVIILKKNKNRFIIENISIFLHKLALLPRDKENDLKTFIDKINYFLEEDEYLNLKKKKRKKLITNYITTIILILLIIGIMLYITYYYYNFDLIRILIASVFAIFGTLCLIIKILEAKNLKVLFLYYDLRYFLLNHNKIIDCFEVWNRNLFENYKIRVTAPISLNYIMFNLNPYQDIEISHLDMKKIKEKYYNQQKKLDEKEEKLFNSIRRNLKCYEQKNYSNYSIN